MAVRNTIDFRAAERALQACGEELKLRMAQHMADRAWMTAPVDTGDLRSSITVVTPSSGPVNLVSGSVVAAISDGGGSGTAVHVVVYSTYSVYVEYGYFAGLTWVPPQPFLRNALDNTLASFHEIVNAEVFAPFRRGGEWSEIQRANPGSSSVRGPVGNDPEGRAGPGGMLPGPQG